MFALPHTALFIMKKNIVLFVLFVLPIVAYLFFASGVNSFTTLPVVSASVPEFNNWKTRDGEVVQLTDHITVLGFGGAEILKNRGNLFNLNKKIYHRYHEFKDLQFVYLCPIGTEQDTKYIEDQFKTFSDMSDWKFVFAPAEEIVAYHKSMKLRGSLNADNGTPEIFIVDKKRNVRGRVGDDYKESYNSFHPSELSNEMLDDFKIVLYEYRAALKKNNNASKRLGE